MNETGLLLSDINKRGLHPGHDTIDPTEVDVTGNAALLRAFDMNFHERLVFEQRHAGLLGRRINNDAVAHEY